MATAIRDPLTAMSATNPVVGAMSSQSSGPVVENTARYVLNPADPATRRRPDASAIFVGVTD
jgi:hypothetical protein